jgi:hypothetical protein
MTNCNRLHRGFASSVASSHLVYRIFKLCWCQYAHSAFLRSSLDLDASYLLVLYGLGANLQLAIRNSAFTLPTFPWKETQRPPKAYRLLRLRSRPTTFLLTTDSSRVLSNICMFTNGDHIIESSSGHIACMSQPFPAFCVDVTN